MVNDEKPDKEEKLEDKLDKIKKAQAGDLLPTKGNKQYRLRGNPQGRLARQASKGELSRKDIAILRRMGLIR